MALTPNISVGMYSGKINKEINWLARLMLTKMEAPMVAKAHRPSEPINMHKTSGHKPPAGRLSNKPKSGVMISNGRAMLTQ